MKKYFFFITSFFFLISSTSYSISNCNDAPSYTVKIKKKIEQQNNMLIFDLFINLELTEKNRNLPTIIDYVPFLKKRNIKEVKVISNMGGAVEEIYFKYNNSKQLYEINYKVNRNDNEGVKLFKYKLEYENGLLKRIKLKNKTKYILQYNSKSKLQAITLIRKGDSYIYNFEYSSKKNSAKLRLDTIIDGKASLGHEVHKTEIVWNKNFKLIAYEIYRYQTNNIKYNMHGDILSFNFDATTSSKDTSWKYTYDKNNYWIKRTSKEFFFSRTITNY